MHKRKQLEDLPQFESFQCKKRAKNDQEINETINGFKEYAWLTNFLYSRVGQPWDQVRSEITHRFDRRTAKRRGVFKCLERHLSDKFEVVDGILQEKE